MRVAGTPPRRRIDWRQADELRLDPVTVDTVDGHTWDGLVLIPRRDDRQARRVAVIVVHGSVGNYITGVPRRVSFGLAQAGFTVVSVNTRMANYGVFFGGGLMHRTPRDLDAWVDFVRRLGYTQIVLLGYSLGATMVTHYQAVRRRPEVVAVCTLAHPLSLPTSLRRRWQRFGADPAYETVVEQASMIIGHCLDDDDGDDEIFVVTRAAGPTTAPVHGEIWTYRTWWFSRGPAAAHAISANWIGQLTVPVALIQAAEDMIVPAEDGETLARMAIAAGVPDVRLEHVPFANHVFSGRDAVVVERVVAWLNDVVVADPGH